MFCLRLSWIEGFVLVFEVVSDGGVLLFEAVSDGGVYVGV